MSLQPTRCFTHYGGELRVYQHASTSTKTNMTFAIFLPIQALNTNTLTSIPIIFWLSGLTCTWENAATKSGLCAEAAKHGIAIVFPDTSPRGAGVPGESDSYDLGVGASFYVDAVTPNWRDYYQMATYITKELPAVIFGLTSTLSHSAISIMGHSMGGLGALSLALRNPGMYRAVTAFSPISHPSEAPWGIKAYSALLGEDNKEAWKLYDPTNLIETYRGPSLPITIEQGLADEFLEKGQLRPNDFLEAGARAGIPIIYHGREKYDHSYYFISSFISEAVASHVVELRK
jgi:S-formylglutathione hydrolase